MKNKVRFFISIFLFLSLVSIAQTGSKALHKGKLFIIGGGSRTTELMKTLVATAELKPADYVVILPMSSEEPDSSFYYIQKDFIKVCSNKIVQLNFTKEKVRDQNWLDSLEKAKLVFITGGDQNRFMKIVLNTPVHKAIKAAYKKGSTIAGTSAGAAVMSREMITGNEYSADSVVSGSFKKILHHMVEIKEGLGLINSAIIDQHFIARSRYNRLLAVLATFPSYTCIGIDEGTAIIVKNNQVKVTGVSQVIRLKLPRLHKNSTKTNDSFVNMRNVQLDILTSGDEFMLN